MENLQLRVEDAGIGFDNGDGTVEGRKREEGVLRANNGGQVQSEILWVHVGGEAEGQALLLSRGISTAYWWVVKLRTMRGGEAGSAVHRLPPTN